jgi:hypothetical protein
MASGIPNATLYAFIIGAAAFLLAVLWTVFSTKEYPPEDIEEFRRKQSEKNIVGHIFKEIWDALKNMPTTMKQLAVVQFFTWFALPCMWQFYGLAVARHVFWRRTKNRRCLPPEPNGADFLCGLQRRLFSRCLSDSADCQSDEPQNNAFYLSGARRSGLALDLFRARQILFVDWNGWRRHRVGVDSLDAVCHSGCAIKPREWAFIWAF